MSKLKPCPFCGSSLAYGYAGGAYTVRCPECRASITMETKDESVKAWNTRHEPTCTMKFQDNGYSKWWECSNCQDTEWYPSLRRCPTCGARVAEDGA